MKYIITDDELLGYVSGAMSPLERKKLEEKALCIGQWNLLLHAELADFAATGHCYADLIGADFVPDYCYPAGMEADLDNAEKEIDLDPDPDL